MVVKEKGRQVLRGPLALSIKDLNTEEGWKGYRSEPEGKTDDIDNDQDGGKRNHVFSSEQCTCSS